MFFSRKGWISISLTIVVIFVALVVVLLGAVMAVNYLSGLRNTTTLVAELAQRSSGFVTDELRDHLDSVVEQSDWVAGLMTDDVVDPADEAVLGQVLLGALAATPQVAMLAFVDPEMTVVRGIRGEAGEGREVRIGPPRDPEFADRMQASARARDDGFWNEILYSERTQRAYVNYVRPVRRDGAFLGVVVALVSLNELSDLVSDVSNQLEGTVFILVERDRVIAHPNLTSPHPELSKASPTVGIGRVGDLVLAQFWSPETEPLKLTGEVENLETRQIEIGGERYILAHVTLDDYGDSPWIVGYHLNAENLESAFHSLHESALVGLVILALGIALAVFLGRKIARPIQAASSGAAQVAELEISELNELPRSPFIELDAQARSFNAMLGALVWFQTYVPKTLVRRLIRRGDTGIPFKQRALTILFTDLVGFSLASEAKSAQDIAEMLNDHFALIGKCIEDEAGTVDKFIGDSLMAFWGAPDPQPDHADRAVRAACAMAKAIAADNARRRAQGLAPVRVRIGLHSGEAVVGNIGAPGRMNYTIVGDTVNTARRMESLGKEVAPDADVVVLASDGTIEAITLEVAYTPVGAFTVKNRIEPVEAFRLKP